MTEHTPAHIKRAGRANPEDLLRQALLDRFGARFTAYREAYHRTLSHDLGFVPEFPITVLVELLNRCNLDCIMCDSSHRQGPKLTISAQTLDRLLTEFNQNSLNALMFGAGEEPLLYKSIDDVFARAQGAGVMDMFLFTNGTMLTPERSEQIVARGLTRVFISIDAATPETYAKIRRRNLAEPEAEDNRLARVEENIRYLVQVRDRAGAKLPIIRVSFTVQPKNEHEIEAFKRKWENVVDYIEFQACMDFKQTNRFSAMPETERWKRIPKAANQGNLTCPQPWNTVTVWSNGDVAPCCNFMGVSIPIGNYREASLKDIWHGDKMSELRDQFRTGELNAVCRSCLGDRDRTRFTKI